MPITPGSNFVLLRRGFPKESISLVNLFCVPIYLFSAYLISNKMRENQRPFLFLKFGIKLYIFLLLVFPILIIYFENRIAYGLLHFTIFLAQLAYSICSIALPAFLLKNCDKSVGGTFISFYMSLANFARLGGEPFILFLLSKTTFTVLASVGFIYEMTYLCYYNKKIDNFDEMDESKFVLSRKNTFLQLELLSKY